MNVARVVEQTINQVISIKQYPDHRVMQQLFTPSGQGYLLYIYLYVPEAGDNVIKIISHYDTVGTIKVLDTEYKYYNDDQINSSLKQGVPCIDSIMIKAKANVLSKYFDVQ